MKKNAVAIITARGGSKRIPRKNIRDFNGKPIIYYSIIAAIESGCFEEVMVSTDDEEIANIAKSLGAKVPFMRSEKNSDDYSMTRDVILEVVDSYERIDREFEFFCCIYPTAPFVTSKKLEESFELMSNSTANTLVPVTRFSYPIQRALKIENQKISMFQPEHQYSRSQDLEPAYHDIGQFYWGRVATFKKQPDLFSDNSICYEVPEVECQDIDNEQDWILAELKFKFLYGEKEND
ncbi:MAG: pseudaminic acid cytidylyltransferase [Halobacteriovorax sp.]|nr:pseudaminic acid cytidylyltransferase [Halobacteriovorax sp.]|tara:strand:- start:156493 stop:157200 length:708 start_codon:yes stop_codon:yes gene_type:complete